MVMPSKVPPTSCATAARSLAVAVERNLITRRSVVAPRESPHAAARTLSTGAGGGALTAAALSALAAPCPPLSGLAALGAELSVVAEAAESDTAGLWRAAALSTGPAGLVESLCAAHGAPPIPSSSAITTVAICFTG